MHQLHFVLTRADSAEEAASVVENELFAWGTENNWFNIGGIASESGLDDIEELNSDSSYPLSEMPFMKVVSNSNNISKNTLPISNTVFANVIAHCKDHVQNTVTLEHEPCKSYESLEKARDAIIAYFQKIDFNSSDSYRSLYYVKRNVEFLEEISSTRRYINRDENHIPEFFRYQFDEFGLTDMSNLGDGKERYIIFVGMHC